MDRQDEARMILASYARRIRALVKSARSLARLTSRKADVPGSCLRAPSSPQADRPPVRAPRRRPIRPPHSRYPEGLKVLRGDIETPVGEDGIQPVQHARHIVVDVDESLYPLDRGGNCTCGKLTAPTVEPTSLYSTSFLATSAPMRSCASSVEPPMCGVRMTLAIPCSGVTNFSLFDAGSAGNTSIAAP